MYKAQISCAITHAYERHYFSRFRLYNIFNFLNPNFKAQLSFCGSTGWLLSKGVGNREDSFFGDEALLSNKYTICR